MHEAVKTAIAYAKRGWYVFPIQPKSKFPYKGFKWKEKSTNDPGLIKAAGLSEKYAGSNWALDCGKSGVFVLDIDLKRGKDGAQSLVDLGVPSAAFVVHTPSGGKHYYYKGHGQNSASNLGPGLDTRGAGGYVLIPGSANGSGAPYSCNSVQIDLDPIPSTILLGLKEVSVKKENADTPVADLDQPANIKAAMSYLENKAPEAIQGDGGDHATYSVCCRLRDFAISEQKALDLLAEHWNEEKAFPPWGVDELQKKIQNAYTYAKDRPGNATPEALFPEIYKSSKLFTTAHELRHNLKPPKFIVKKYIEEETTNLWFGEPGSFKSFITIDIGVAIAAGQPWGGEETQKGAVFYLAGEGHGGMARRIEACCKARGVHKEDHIPFYVSNTAIPLSNSEIVAKLSEAIQTLRDDQDTPVRLIVVDTLAANFGAGDENSTKDMSNFINLINTKLRQPLKCAILINHHSGHGDKHRARGSSALDAGLDSFSKIHREDMMSCVRQPGKMKDAEPFRDVWFESEVVNVGVDEDLMPVTSLCLHHAPEFKGNVEVKALGENQSIILNALTAKNDMTVVGLRDEFKTAKENSGKKFDRANFKRVLESMAESGHIYKKDGKISLEA